MTTRGVLLAGLALAWSVAAFAADMKAYQVTGPVLDVSADSITVQKGREKWVIGRTADTKVTGDLKAGEKVTVMYGMTATSIEVKPAGKSGGKHEAKSGATKH